MKTIKRMRERIERTSSIPSEERAALLTILEELRAELNTLPDPESARSVTAYAEISVREATRRQTDEGLLEHALEGLRRSSERFRVEHPRLRSLLEDVAAALSRIG